MNIKRFFSKIGDARPSDFLRKMYCILEIYGEEVYDKRKIKGVCSTT